MIKRTTKYIASDGTKHDSPQEAATWDLNVAMEKIVRDGGFTDHHDCLDDFIGELARNPEALRDAVNAYFEDLEGHPDVNYHFVSVDAEALKLGFQDLCDAGNQDAGKRPAQGNPDDPTAWRAELPVDHPSDCRPFGTRED